MGACASAGRRSGEVDHDASKAKSFYGGGAHGDTHGGAAKSLGFELSTEGDLLRLNDVVIKAGRCLVSPNWRYQAVMLHSGSFVVRCSTPGGPLGDSVVWSTRTCRHGAGPPYRMTLTEEGNLELSDARYEVLWSSRSSRKGWAPFRMRVRNDGCLLVLDKRGKEVWHTEPPEPELGLGLGEATTASSVAGGACGAGGAGGSEEYASERSVFSTAGVSPRCDSSPVRVPCGDESGAADGGGGGSEPNLRVPVICGPTIETDETASRRYFAQRRPSPAAARRNELLALAAELGAAEEDEDAGCGWGLPTAEERRRQSVFVSPPPLGPSTLPARTRTLRASSDEKRVGGGGGRRRRHRRVPSQDDVKSWRAEAACAAAEAAAAAAADSDGDACGGPDSDGGDGGGGGADDGSDSESSAGGPPPIAVEV